MIYIKSQDFKILRKEHNIEGKIYSSPSPNFGFILKMLPATSLCVKLHPKLSYEFQVTHYVYLGCQVGCFMLIKKSILT